ncbi:unnamed protein product, partial [Tetraodon nigroviridis]
PQMMKPIGGHSTYHALRGQTLELECIVQGLPTPKVSWLRRDGEMSESRTSKEMFDRRLYFNNISESDGGEYQCIAENSQGKIVHTYTVTVEASPYWINAPASQLYAPGETVKLDCQADGIPPPTITWTVNGVPLSATAVEPRRLLTDSGSLILKDVSFGDTAIYQCQASNKHGTILTNTNVYVIELPPQILTEDGSTYTFVEGQKAVLECETFGSPKPKVTWESSSTSLPLADPRVNLLTNGGLEVSNVSHDDEGIYTCSIQNSNVSVSAELEVLNRTVILSPPQALRMQPGKTAIFTCMYITDPKLHSPVLQWRKNDQKIFESHSDEKYTFEGPDLIISNVEPGDEGVYTCQIITKLDMAEASSNLTLCGKQLVGQILITEIMQTSHCGPTCHTVFGSLPLMIRAKATPAIHQTSTKHLPMEMDKRNLNGPDFKYRVMWRRVVGSGPDWHEQYTNAPPLIVNDTQNFSAFEIKVQAVNERGRGPEPDPVIGYSGEDVPLEPPLDVGILMENSTTIKVTWAPIDKETVRGRLLGYKIYLTRRGSRVHHQARRTQEPESTVVVQTGASEEKKLISDLQPFSSYDIAVIPGPPMSLVLDSPSETEITLHWTPPDQPNGILIGYELQYQQIMQSDDSPMQVEDKVNPQTTSLMLKGLDRHSHYRFYLMGRTAAGLGEPIKKDGATTLDGLPPANISLSAEEKLVNLSWEARRRHRNIGFQIHYLNKNDGGQWKKTEKVNSSQLFYQLQGLTPGTQYRLLFTYRNNTFWETEIQTKGTMKDKEEGPMDSEARPMKDETFGEYSDLEEKRTASQPSLGEDSKLCSEDNLDFNGSSAITTELNMDESLASQFSRHSEGPEPFHGVPDNSPLNPAAVPPATNGMPNLLN